MLTSCLSYSNIISTYYNARFNYFLNDEDWHNASIIHKFLKPFYIATNQLSSQYYPTSSLVLVNLFNITNTFQQYRTFTKFENIIKVMEEKYNSYWDKPLM